VSKLKQGRRTADADEMALRFVAPLLLLLLSACVLEPSIGNTIGSCAPGTRCVCDGIGNCSKTCTGEGCAFECSGIGNCMLSCPKGGCTVVTSGTGNAFLTCDGNGCAMTCNNTGNCAIISCAKNCTCSQASTGICTNSCVDPSCH
jgi:hypothetical protein